MEGVLMAGGQGQQTVVFLCWWRLLFRVLIMSQQLAGPVSSTLHQIGNTLAWSGLLNISLLFIHTRHHRHSLLLHSVMGWIIFALTYIDILIILIPFGFDVTVANSGVLLVVHAIGGFCMMGFVVLQVAGGVLIRLQLGKKETNMALVAKVKKGHAAFGYFLAVTYKINVIWSWYPTFVIMGLLLVWEAVIMAILIHWKRQREQLKEVVTDVQTVNEVVRQVHSTKEIQSLTSHYIIFQNYVYQADQLAQRHPGGSRVIETVMGREVDRFLYGMYSSELLPSLPPHSHSANCLRLAGKPIAQLVVPPTYDGFSSTVIQASIAFVHTISQKTQIYQLGMKLNGATLSFRGYTHIQQLGQYYSFTTDDQVTRLYTAVNFLTPNNVDLMMTILPQLKGLEFYKHAPEDLKGKRPSERKMRETELSELKDKGLLKENLLQTARRDAGEGKGDFLPIMLKVYPNGKLTSMLKQQNFKPNSVRISSPMGRGLQLDCTPAGKIIILAGGTGLFPFCDLIDLLFKADLVAQGHQQRQRILKENPILQSHSFQQNTFTMLIAINEPEDIHPITLHQLIHLSKTKDTKIVMRVSKNQQQISAIDSKIEFTRDYFNKRVVAEAGEPGVARVWICGPPKLSSDTAAGLLDSGIKREAFLLV